MEEMTKHGQVGLAAMRAGMDRKTARKYVTAGKLPSEMSSPRTVGVHDEPRKSELAGQERFFLRRVSVASLDCSASRLR
jgi:predicted site-specific integrase-resolvase